MNVGDTFIYDEPGSHLKIIVTEPDPGGQVVMLGITTWRPHGDPTCRIEPTDHRFVTRTSVIAYQHAVLVPLAQLDALLQARRLLTRAPVTPTLLARIRAGALASPRTPEKVRAAVEACPWQPF